MNREVLLALAIAGFLSVGAVWAIAATAEPVPAGASVGPNGLPSLTTIAGPTLEGTTAVGETTSEIVAIGQGGLVNVTFRLRWTAGSGESTLQLAAAPSNATGLSAGAQSEPESDGEIVLTMAVANEAADGQLGVGDWELSVTFVEASTGTPLPAGAVPTMSDGNVSWTIETSLDAYS